VNFQAAAVVVETGQIATFIFFQTPEEGIGFPTYKALFAARADKFTMIE
jgi:hypothetical protein